MSLDNPVYLFSSSSPNAPWSVVDMAAAAVVQSAVTASAPAKSVLDEGLSLSELMDLEQSPDFVASPWLVSSFSLVDQAQQQQSQQQQQQQGFAASPPSQIVSPHHLFFKASDSSPPGYRSFGSLGAFSLDSTLLEDLLADSNEITSTNFEDQDSRAPNPLPDSQLVPGSTNYFTERLKEALRLISRSETEALAQVWVPMVNKDNKTFLTTQEQPYSVMHSKFDLLRYRSLSTAYVFPFEKPGSDSLTSGTSSAPSLGLPGRVFSSMEPEWTPNVRFYDSSEYLRIREAAKCDVKGLVAVPVIDPTSRSCLAVIELVTNVEKVEFGSEIGIICNALQAVNLAGTPKENNPMLLKMHSEGQETVYQEISEVMQVVCKSHKLPVAQTWLPCLHNGKGREEVLVGDSMTGIADPENISLFTRDAPFYVAEPRLLGFHHACSEHSLERGQGVAGKAFVSNQPCFIQDVRSYSIEEYPLVHHARYFKLAGSMAIRMRSSFTGAADYILEFFLPVDLSDGRRLFQSISATMQRTCRSLRTLSAEELGRDRPLGGSTAVVAPEAGTTKKSHPMGARADALEAKLHKSKKTRASQDLDVDFQMGDVFNNPATTAVAAMGVEISNTNKKRLDRKRSMSEKTIGLEVLQQYFAGSLKDAAKSIGVCPTTLKRICRQYGISRWPSRKINKVSRSLIKLQGVIDSVQGLDGAVKLNALTGELASAAAAAAAITKKNSQKADSSATPAAAAADPRRSTSPEFDAPAAQPIKDFLSDTEERDNSECEGRTSWLSHYLETGDNPRATVKMEPRVHGSFAALAALNGSPLDEDTTTGTDDAGRATSSPEPEQSRTEAGHASPPYPSSGDCPSPLSSPTTSRYGSVYSITVKATLASDTVRFKVPYTGFGYSRLRDEVCARFRVERDGFTLKYLDDDSEWVLLDGDADLEECLDVMKGAHTHTIKLAVIGGGNNSSHHSVSSVKL